MKKIGYFLLTLSPSVLLAEGTTDTTITDAITAAQTSIMSAVTGLTTSAKVVCAAVLVLALVPVCFKFVRKWLGSR